MLHAVVKSSLNDKDGNLTAEGRDLIDSFRKTLSGRQRRIIKQRIDDNYRFKRDSEGRKIKNKDGAFVENPYEQYAEEYLTSYIDAAVKGQLNQGPLGTFFTNIFKQKGFDKAYFEEGSDLKAFLNSFPCLRIMSFRLMLLPYLPSGMNDSLIPIFTATFA